MNLFKENKEKRYFWPPVEVSVQSIWQTYNSHCTRPVPRASSPMPSAYPPYSVLCRVLRAQRLATCANSRPASRAQFAPFVPRASRPVFCAALPALRFPSVPGQHFALAVLRRASRPVFCAAVLCALVSWFSTAPIPYIRQHFAKQ